MQMRPKTRQRVMRIILASLMESDLSISELRELATDMEFGSFSTELHRLIIDTIGHLSESRSQKHTQGDPESNADIAYREVQRRRLSKSALLDIMAVASPQKSYRSPRATKTVRDILAEYFLTASQRERELLLSMLLHTKGSDEYLEGIVRRR